MVEKASASAQGSPLDFYFDFSSPYGYLASERIDALAARFGREVRWHPVLLGVLFKATGAVPLTEAPLKGAYSKHDFARSARYLGLPYAEPPKFPVSTHQAARAFYVLAEQSAPLAKDFAHRVFRAYFVNGQDVSDLSVVLRLAEAAGADAAVLATALDSEPVKQHLKDAVAAALARGVFGSPMIYCDGEPFMGADRLPQLEHWLETGGF